jgi:hypothetical protein
VHCHTSFFTREFLTEKKHDCRPPPTLLKLLGTLLLFSLSLIEDIIQVIEAELQVVNTLTEQDFQDAF